MMANCRILRLIPDTLKGSQLFNMSTKTQIKIAKNVMRAETK